MAIFGGANLGAGPSTYNPFGGSTGAGMKNPFAMGPTGTQAQPNTLRPPAPTPAPAPRPTPRPATQPANLQYITEGNRALNMPTTQGQVFDQLQQYYAPRGLGYVRPDAPSQDQLKQIANQITSAGGAYQNSADKFGSLYADLVEGRMPQESYVNNLQKMQELSRTAAGQYDTVNSIFNNPMFNPVQTTAGVPQQRNTLGLNPAQRFTLPKETWDMKPQELMNWINRHERNAGKDSFMGNAAWLAGPALIGGAAAAGLTGTLAPSLTNSVLGTGIEKGLGVDSRASGGIIDLIKGRNK
jgi:hypothetical protein